MSPTKLSSSLLIFLVSMVTIGYALDCSNIHYKESEGVLNYLANVTFTVPYTTSGWRFYFQFDRNFTGIGVWDGFIQTNGDAGSAIMTNKTSNGELTRGDEFSFRFRINWSEVTPAKNPPVLERFGVGDVELCL
ncbi:uncharacterized protein LOC110857265 [Folsomia candida]|nr:uncharacterized protein LOC110857265 [Folsomia candida]